MVNCVTLSITSRQQTISVAKAKNKILNIPTLKSNKKTGDFGSTVCDTEVNLTRIFLTVKSQNHTLELLDGGSSGSTTPASLSVSGVRERLILFYCLLVMFSLFLVLNYTSVLFRYEQKQHQQQRSEHLLPRGPSMPMEGAEFWRSPLKLSADILQQQQRQ